MQAVGTRACYLFSRLVKTLRQNMRPLLSDVLIRLQPHLAHILAKPLPEAEPAAKGAGKPSDFTCYALFCTLPYVAVLQGHDLVMVQAISNFPLQCKAC